MFVRNDLFGDVRIAVKNIGESAHQVQQEGTFCKLSTIEEDLSERDIRVFEIFTGDRNIEPAESINDTLYWKIPRPIDKIVWVRLQLRFVSKGVEWVSSSMIRVDRDTSASQIEVI